MVIKKSKQKKKKNTRRINRKINTRKINKKINTRRINRKINKKNNTRRINRKINKKNNTRKINTRKINGGASVRNLRKVHNFFRTKSEDEKVVDFIFNNRLYLGQVWTDSWREKFPEKTREIFDGNDYENLLVGLGSTRGVVLRYTDRARIDDDSKCVRCVVVTSPVDKERFERELEIYKKLKNNKKPPPWVKIVKTFKVLYRKEPEYDDRYFGHTMAFQIMERLQGKTLGNILIRKDGSPGKGGESGTAIPPQAEMELELDDPVPKVDEEGGAEQGLDVDGESKGEAPVNLSLKDRVTISVSLLRSLKFFTLMGIAHNDLNPENIMVCDIKGLKIAVVIDFGEALFIGENGKLLGRRDESRLYVFKPETSEIKPLNGEPRHPPPPFPKTVGMLAVVEPTSAVQVVGKTGGGSSFNTGPSNNQSPVDLYSFVYILFDLFVGSWYEFIDDISKKHNRKPNVQQILDRLKDSWILDDRLDKTDRLDETDLEALKNKITTLIETILNGGLETFELYDLQEFVEKIDGLMNEIFLQVLGLSRDEGKAQPGFTVGEEDERPTPLLLPYSVHQESPSNDWRLVRLDQRQHEARIHPRNALTGKGMVVPDQTYTPEPGFEEFDYNPDTEGRGEYYNEGLQEALNEEAEQYNKWLDFASRQYLLSQGFSQPEITKIEEALDRSEMAPGEWLGTLKGLAMDELKQIAVADVPSE